MNLLKKYKEEILDTVAFSSFYNRPELCYLKDRVKNKSFAYYSFNHTQFKTYKDKSTLYIIFEGTNGFSDWRDNLTFYKTSTKVIPYENVNQKIRVHKGFITQYKNVRKKIQEIVKKSKYKKIIVTGHSLGGALAILCSVDLQYNFDIEVQCFSYANPNVGNKAFTDSFKKRIPLFFSFRNRRDIVCNVPFRIFFYSVLKRIKVKSKKNNFFSGFTLFGNWKDHYPDRYEQALDDLLK